MLIRSLSITLLLSLLLSSCEASGPAVEVNGQRYQVEIAADDNSRIQGLMFREEMPLDHGMLFIFHNEQPRSFWMKNTWIPLDIIYIDSERKVVSVIENARPCRTTRCPGYPSTGPAQYVLELNAGQADELHLAAGDELLFIDIQ
ncbi:MAG: DUF192 domain-containing protein [Wenzhouxiangellaceae bacterium]